uniref:Uncharacterized protein n=2 Tax=Clastoptera arizonana TaxID=38151 RepID=A0A1B6C962_9HEMI
MRNHKNASTFEEFAAQVYSPVQTPSPFSQGPTRASGVSCRSVEGSCQQPSNITTLAAALIDSHTSASTHNMRGRLQTDVSRLREGRVWFMGESDQHGISPRPLKKLSLKTGPKRMNPSLTPPDSPTSRRSK